MKLIDLISDLPDARIIGDSAVEVGGVADDSRRIAPGDVFVAVSHLSTDGHQFVEAAIAAGAVAVAVERKLPVDVPQVIVSNGADALGAMAARAAGRPADTLGLVGITGTNGKTTTTYLMESILAAAGQHPGVIGTVNYRFGGVVKPAPFTTPTPLVLHSALAEMVEAGCSHAVLEVSSAALSMKRMAGVQARVAAFTNLTQDHLDVHDSMEAYRDAKARLFADHLAADGVAVINVDDPAAPAMIAAAGHHKVLRVTTDPEGDGEIRVSNATSTIDGITAIVTTPRGDITIRSAALIGGYNIANVALAVGISEALGLDHDAVARGVVTLAGVPGRVERVANDHDLTILVDYAHTPDALRNVLSALAPLCEHRLICVFGCGGDRDPTKRPLMGAAVAELADVAVVTSDNPRTEDPAAIIDMILPAVPEPFFVNSDRRTAIRAAVAEAVPGDIVLIAGKGHEDYQVLGTTKIHFDDREEAAAATELRQTWSIDDVAALTGATIAQRGSDERSFLRVHFDGRIAAARDLYVAIRGETHDGHAFCKQAVDAGATGLVVDKDWDPASAGAKLDATVFVVADTRVAIGQIARRHRERWRELNPRARLVGVTGSAGKTTTKQLIAAALAQAGPVRASEGSLNNETGVPITVLGLHAHHDFAVVEMGMRGLGQIEYLCHIARPDVGVVVNAGTAHVGVVGSVDAIAHGKAEIWKDLPADGWAVLPAADARLARHALAAPNELAFGEDEAADVRLADCELASQRDGGQRLITVEVRGKRYRMMLPMVGKHNAINATCAIAVAVALEVPMDAVMAGLATARSLAMRSEVRAVRGRKVLVDCYNANPASTQAALQTLAELAADHHALAVLADMLELGDEAPGAHEQIGARAAELGIEVIALGHHRGDIERGVVAAGGTVTLCDDPTAAAAETLSRSQHGDWVLVKASRGMRLERVVAAMEDAD